MKFLFFVFSIVFSVIISTREILGGNILIYSPVPAPSHFKPYERLFVTLARRGHNVTVLSMFPPSEQIENYTHLKIDDVVRLTQNFTLLKEKTEIERYVITYNIVQNLVEQSFHDNSTIYLLQSKSKFDVIMLELYHIDGCLALAHLFDAPVIGLSHQSLVPVYNWVIGNPMKLAYVPHLYTSFTNDMSFVERFFNAILSLFAVLFYQFVSLAEYQDQGDTFMKLANSDRKFDVELVSKNIALVLVESHFSAGYPQPNLPNVVEVAGIHIPPPKPLPNHLSDFIENADSGIIYVSLGTLVDAVSMNDFGKKLISVFKRLHYRIIWKWNPELIANNSNILTRNWLPQNDILNHPKTKLFISHGGYHSLLEAVNAGVPILCFPFFNDQYYNAAISEKYNFGMKEDLDATEEEIFQKIQDLISNRKYSENAKKQSVIFKDRPIDPLDQAIYWTEYVIRHKGASHLRPASIQLRWYEYFLLDVISCMILVLVLVLYILKLMARSLIKLCFNNVNGKIKKN